MKRRCTAHLSDGSGRRCKLSPVRGAVVCHKHGAGKGSPAAKTARQRLTALAEPAITALSSALEMVERDPRIALHPAVQRAAVAVLDRSGYHPKADLEIDHRISEAQARTIADVIRGVLRDLGVDRPDAGPIIRRHLLRVAGSNDHADRAWAELATPQERKVLMEIMERCQARAEGRAPESCNGSEPAAPAPPPPKADHEVLEL